MADHVTHESVQSVSGTLARAGGTRRPEIRVPETAADQFPDKDVVRLVLDGTEYRSQLAARPDGTPVIRSAYESPSEARTPGDARNHLVEWVESRDLSEGRTVHVDVVESGFKYGLRAPGESATYHATEPPSSSLADIASSVEES
jgi:hypothetical protein